MKQAIVPLAEGVEEMEAVIIIDVLRRGGVDVVSAAIGDTTRVEASRGVVLVADALWDDAPIASADALILPGGGPGMQRLREDERVLAAVCDYVDALKLVGAICAAPLVLQAAGVLEGRKATCYPALQPQLTSARLQDGIVVEDGLLITSLGPGTAMHFALVMLRRLVGAAEADAIRDQLVMPDTLD
jgi:4-methyl-5(b-hydroxyethyl)-thiazole monophosphate biosynthesis